MLLGITGFLIIFIMVFLLLKEKPYLCPFCYLIGALINGFSISEIADFVTKGCSTVWPMAALFVFTVTYFDLMADVGLFDKVVEKIRQDRKRKCNRSAPCHICYSHCCISGSRQPPSPTLSL